MEHQKRSLRISERIQSFRYGFQGICYAVKTQPNIRIHILIATVVILAGLWLHLSKTEWFFVFTCVGLVIGMELFNSALENLCDAVHPEQSNKIKHVKDMAAGAVLLSAIIAAIIGLWIFIPKFVS